MATALAAAAAAAAAAECVGPLPSFGTAGPSYQCRNRVFRVQLAVLPSSRRVAASAAAPAVAARADTGFVPGAWSNAARANAKSGQRTWRWRAVAEQLQGEMEETSETAFPSDSISVFFEAEGSLPDSSVSKLTTTLEGLEGVSDVHVTATSDGTATVKLTKQMNVQATGVASGLVEVLLADNGCRSTVREFGSSLLASLEGDSGTIGKHQCFFLIFPKRTRLGLTPKDEQ